MPAPRPRKYDAWFRLRSAATFCLAAGLWLSVWKTARGPEPQETEFAGQSSLAVLPDGEGTNLGQPWEERPAIVIDPGHGGRDPGKPAGEQLEKTWTLQVSLALAEELRSRGWPVVLTRSDDTTVTLTERSDLANREPRRAMVSIHFNSGGPEANGMEVYFAWPKLPETMARLDGELNAPVNTSILDERGRLLAESLLTAACSATGSRNRGVKNDPELAVLNRTVCPAVLVECGFLTNEQESRNIRTGEWRRKLVVGLADGLESWLHASKAPGYGIAFEPAELIPVSSGAQ